MAVTEGWAALFEGLVDEPAWLNRRLDVPKVHAIANAGAVTSLYFLRRYSAKLLYEIEFFQAADAQTMRPRYAELLTEALKIPANPESYLDDIDGSFYVTGYLRSWALRGAAARLPALRARERLVRPARRGRSAPRALVARPGPDGRRAPRRRDRRSASRWAPSPTASARASPSKGRRSAEAAASGGRDGGFALLASLTPREQICNHRQNKT